MEKGATYRKEFFHRQESDLTISSEYMVRSLGSSRPVTSLGHQGSEEFSERGPNF